MGLNFIDMLVDTLKFKDFRDEPFSEKIRRIVTYPIALLLLVLIIIISLVRNITSNKRK